jgi:hypothetical protein
VTVSLAAAAVASAKEDDARNSLAATVLVGIEKPLF